MIGRRYEKAWHDGLSNLFRSFSPCELEKVNARKRKLGYDDDVDALAI